MKGFEHHPTIEELGGMGFENGATTQRHVVACSTCRTRLAELERVRHVLASTATIDLTPSRVLTEGALAQLQRRKAGVVRVNGLLSVIGAIFAGFAVLLPRQKASAAVSAIQKERDDDE